VISPVRSYRRRGAEWHWHQGGISVSHNLILNSELKFGNQRNIIRKDSTCWLCHRFRHVEKLRLALPLRCESQSSLNQINGRNVRMTLSWRSHFKDLWSLARGRGQASAYLSPPNFECTHSVLFLVCRAVNAFACLASISDSLQARFFPITVSAHEHVVSAPPIFGLLRYQGDWPPCDCISIPFEPVSKL
jgi:hypothetical protein